LKRIIKKLITRLQSTFSDDKSMIYSNTDDINMTCFINL